MKKIQLKADNRDEYYRVLKKKAERKRTRELTLLTIPGVIFMLVFSYLPMLGVIIAFQDYSPRLGLFGSKFIGFKNFEFLFQSPDILRLIRNTVAYGATFIIVDLIAAVSLALLFFHVKHKFAQNTYRTIFQLPRFLSIIVISYVTYALLSPSYGILNQIVTAFGGEAIKWYSEPAYWPFILTFVHVWMTVGGGCLLYYSNLLSIDPALYEAAEIDGATVLQKDWYISIPSLKPLIALNLIMSVGALISVDMGLFDAIPRAQGILFETTDVINTYVYRGVLRGDVSMPAAVGLFQSVVALILVLSANAVVRKISPENSMF